MKKFLCSIFCILLLISNTFTFAAENYGLSYNENPYWAVVKKGVNLRDKDNNIMCYIKAKSYVYVLGVSKDDSSRVVVEWDGLCGTVLKAGVKKISSPNEHSSSSSISYSGSSYYGKAKNRLNVRDAYGNVIGKINKDEVVYVYGTYSANSERVVIEYDNTLGTVLKTGLKKVSFNENNSSSTSNSLLYHGNSYFAVTKNNLNMRDASGSIIYKIPKNSPVYVRGIYSNDETRVTVLYYGMEGTVLKNGVKKAEDAIFLNIAEQKVFLVKNNKIIAESKCVTGTKNVNDTPKGSFKVTEMVKGKTLTGDDYSQYVNYWVRFCEGCGLHDASWRKSFGGNIYKNSGSHGCVNLPLNFAKTLYDNAYIGMPVYIL